MDHLLRRLVRLGVDRGVTEHTAWFGIALAAYFLRRARRRDHQPVASVPISKGESLLVRLSDPSTGPPINA